jgi:hypothetical protein
MFTRSLAAGCALLVSALSADAVTILPGETYEGIYAASTDQIDTSMFAPILSIDGPILYVQYNIDFPDLAPGGKVTITHLAADRSLFGEVELENASAFPGFVGGAGGPCMFCELPVTGFIQVRNDSATALTLGGSFWPTGIQLALTVAATVDIPALGDAYETSLSFVSPVTDFRLVSPVTPPPVDPPPGVIPLPAAGWLLLAGIGSFALVRRRHG